MTYTVIWLRREEARLLQFWLDADDKQAVSEASHRIDKHLRHHPRLQAERITSRLWELQVAPLAVAYYIRDPDRIVRVVGVRLLTESDG